MRHTTLIICWIILSALLAACSGEKQSATNEPTDKIVDSVAAPVAYRVMDGYLEQPGAASDRDFDGIPDDGDEYPDQAVVQGPAFGASAFVIDRVFTASDKGSLESATTGIQDVTVVGRGLDRTGGKPKLVFTGSITAVVRVPEQIDATTWSATPPKGAEAVFAVSGNERSNAFPIHWLADAAPKLARVEASVATGSVLEIAGFELDAVTSAHLGGEDLEIVSKTSDRLRVRLPAAPASNTFRAFSSGLASNSLQLNLQHQVRLGLDSALSLPIGTTVSVRHEGAQFDLTADNAPALTVTGHVPYAFYLAADGEPGRLGAIAWPDEADITVSSTTTLMTELWVHRLSLPMDGSMSWRDQRAFLQNAMQLPESQAFISGHQASLAGSSDWNRYVARQAVMDAIAASVGTVSTEIPVSKTSSQQQATMIRSEELDDLVAFTISPATTAGPEFGDNSTVDQPRVDIPGTTYAQFEVAGHAETRFLFDICSYPPNTPTPSGIWPSDLCVQNGTTVFASYSVYQPDGKTFGVPYSGAASDLKRKHIEGPGSTEAASNGAAYMTDNRNGGPADQQPTLCRLQTCYIEVLTSGFGNGYKDTGLTASERRIVRDLRMKWVFEGMIIPIISDKLGLAQLPACLPGEMYGNVDFYPKIEALVAGIRVNRASHTVTQAKQLFDDIVGEWLKNILAGALAENGNIVNCVATEVTKSAIKDAFINATEFGSILNNALFVGGLILTPEKFTFKVQYRTEVADVLADIADDGVTTEIDTVNGLYYGAAQNPRLLTITGTWIADENASDATRSYYPIVIFRDSAGNTERLPIDSSHYVETGQIAWRQLDIPVASLVDDSFGVDLNRLVPGEIDVTLEYYHANFVGYDDGKLRVSSPVSIRLKNQPQVLGFTPPSAPPGALISANGSGLDVFGNAPKIELFRHAGSGDFVCENANQATKVNVPPANVLSSAGGEEVNFLLPDNLDLNAFYYVCIGESTANTASRIPFFSLDSNQPGTGQVTFSDFGRVKDDAIRLSVLGDNGFPISFEDLSCQASDPTCERQVVLTFDIPNPDDGKRVRTVWWDNNVLNNSYGLNARSILLECIDSGSDTTCTYGIGASNVQINEVSGSNAVISDAGKFSPGDKIEYRIVYP